MKEIIDRINSFNNDRDWDKFHSPENLAKSISIESGELLECFQWDSNYDINEVKDELADIFTYSLMLAEKLDLDIYEIINKKIDKNEEKYPIEKSKGKSTKYDKL